MVCGRRAISRPTGIAFELIFLNRTFLEKLTSGRQEWKLVRLFTRQFYWQYGEIAIEGSIMASIPPKLFSTTFQLVAKMAIAVDMRAAFIAIGWFLRGKRVRGWSQMAVLAGRHPEFYANWIRFAEPLRFADVLAGQAEGSGLSNIAVLIWRPADVTEVDLEASVASLRATLGSQLRIWSNVFDAPGVIGLSEAQSASLRTAVKAILDEPGIAWLMPVVAGDTFSDVLGCILSQQIQEAGDASLLFWDEDVIADGSRTAPWLKPGWDKLFFLACDGVSGAALLSKIAVLDAIDATAELAIDQGAIVDLVLHFGSEVKPEQVVHLPHILTHRRRRAALPAAERRATLINRMHDGGYRAEPHAGCGNCLAIRPSDPDVWPSVSILIPTKDHVALLRACIESLANLMYPGDVEIIVIDNGSILPATLEYLDYLVQGEVATCLKLPGPFNFSHLNNEAARSARGEFLCLLNNDVEARDGHWLTELIRHAVRPDVGAVGAKLLYPDGAIQHAGVAIGVGDAAGHVQRGVMVGDPDDVRLHGISRRVLAVTAACLVVSRADFERVGGLDAEVFPVAFNDVDFCLKLGEAGLYNIYVAEACLVHHESKSRGSDLSPSNRKRFEQELASLQRRWQTKGYVDPCLNPNISRVSERALLSL